MQMDLGKWVLLFSKQTSLACWKPKYCWNFLVAENPSGDPVVQRWWLLNSQRIYCLYTIDLIPYRNKSNQFPWCTFIHAVYCLRMGVRREGKRNAEKHLWEDVSRLNTPIHACLSPWERYGQVKGREYQLALVLMLLPQSSIDCKMCLIKFCTGLHSWIKAGSKDKIYKSYLLGMKDYKFSLYTWKKLKGWAVFESTIEDEKLQRPFVFYFCFSTFFPQHYQY